MTLDCEAVSPWLAPFVDGERTLIPAEALRAHLQGCARCGREAERLHTLLEAVNAAYRAPEVPEPLRRRVERTRWVARLRRRAPAVAAASAAVALLLVGALLWEGRRSAEAARLSEAVALFEALGEGALPLDWREADPARVSAEVSRRLRREVAFTEVARSGLTVEGARWLGPGTEGALVMFRGQGRRVGLMVRPGPRAARATRPTGFAEAQVAARRVISWQHGDVGYTLISEDAASARQGCGTCHVPGASLLE